MRLWDYSHVKGDNIIDDIEVVEININNVMVVRNCNFLNRIKHLIFILSLLCISVLNVNACLDYIITQEGISPDKTKLKEIMDLRRPTINTEARSRIGMVWY